MSMVYCPLCKKVHEMDYKTEDKVVPLGGKKITFVIETITCHNLDLQKQNMRLKSPAEQDDAKEGLIKELWTSMVFDDKKRILEELQRKLQEELDKAVEKGKQKSDESKSE